MEDNAHWSRNTKLLKVCINNELKIFFLTLVFKFF